MSRSGSSAGTTTDASKDEGCVFGSHSASHPFLTALSPAEVAREAARSRAILTRGLGRPVIAFAYPHGAEDAAVQHLVGAGYIYGLSRRPGPSRLGDPLLALPRVEVTSTDTLVDFIAKLGEYEEGSTRPRGSAGPR
jgi:peptidoglycan/xylan/chitin deacetylase (PgdA/CDA1 family)